MQADGNLVLYQNGVAALWATNVYGTVAVMQGDGNFVVYDGGTAVWTSGTSGNPGANLAVQTDGNLVIYGGSGALWNSGTCCH